MAKEIEKGAGTPVIRLQAEGHVWQMPTQLQFHHTCEARMLT